MKEVPVDGFWSVSAYNAEGYFQKNPANMYALNNLTAKRGSDGAITIQFGRCDAGVPNCLPVVDGWNYTVRLYRPRAGGTAQRLHIPRGSNGRLTYTEITYARKPPDRRG